MSRIGPAPRQQRLRPDGPLMLAPRPGFVSAGWTTPELVGAVHLTFATASSAVGAALPLPEGALAGDTVVAVIEGPYNAALTGIANDLNIIPMQVLTWLMATDVDTRSFPGQAPSSSLARFGNAGDCHDTPADCIVTVWRGANVIVNYATPGTAGSLPSGSATWATGSNYSPSALGLLHGDAPSPLGRIVAQYGGGYLTPGGGVTFDPPYSQEVFPAHIVTDSSQYRFSAGAPVVESQPRMHNGLAMVVNGSYYFWRYFYLTFGGANSVTVARDHNFTSGLGLGDPFPARNVMANWGAPWSPVPGLEGSEMSALLSTRAPAEGPDLFTWPWDRTIADFQPRFDLDSNVSFPYLQTHRLCMGYVHVSAFSYHFTGTLPPPRLVSSVLADTSRSYRLPQGD